MSYWVIRPFFEFLTIMGIEDCVESDKTDMVMLLKYFETHSNYEINLRA
jgi:hypothetical protein